MKIFTVYSEQDLGSERAFSTLEAARSYMKQVTPAGMSAPQIFMHVIRDDMSPSEVAVNLFNRERYSKHAEDAGDA